MLSNQVANPARPVPDHLVGRLHAAAGALESTTFDDLGMREIARITGIPRATLYYHFSKKDELVTFLLRTMLEDLRHAVGAAIDRGGDVAVRLRAVVEAQFEHLAANPSLGRLLLVNLGRVERLRILGDGVEAGFRAPVRQLLTEAGAGAADVDAIATALYGAVTFVGLDSLLRRGTIESSSLADAVFSTFWHGASGVRS
jgi:AcrR family transcriptional regulator